MKTRQWTLAVAGLAALLAVLGAITILSDGDDGREIRTLGPSTTVPPAPAPPEATATTATTDVPATTEITGTTTASLPRSTVPPTTAPTVSRIDHLPMTTPADIVFAGPHTGWVVGYSQSWGTVARTTDGGLTWEWTCLADRLISQASFLDADRGFAVAANAHTRNAQVLLVTTDGGRTFEERPISIPAQSISGLHFSDEHTGWFAGASAAEGAIGAAMVAATADGGRVWTATTFPGLRVDGLLVRDGIVRVTGWSGDGVAVVLTSAGDGWTRTEVPGPSALHAIASTGDTLVAVGISRSDAAGQLVGPPIARSTDGGATWQPVEGSAPANLWDVVEQGGVLFASGSVAGAPAVVVSRDEGLSWEVAVEGRREVGGPFLDVSAAGSTVAAVGYQPGAVISVDVGPWRTVTGSFTSRC